MSNIRSLCLASSMIILMKLFHTLLHSFHAIFPDIQHTLLLLEFCVGPFSTMPTVPPSVIPEC